jgi:hypothetical protein
MLDLYKTKDLIFFIIIFSIIVLFGNFELCYFTMQNITPVYLILHYEPCSQNL